MCDIGSPRSGDVSVTALEETTWFGEIADAIFVYDDDGRFLCLSIQFKFLTNVKAVAETFLLLLLQVKGSDVVFSP